MKIKINLADFQGKTYKYIPTWKNNDKDSNPITFDLRHLTVSEWEECFNYQNRRFNNAVIANKAIVAIANLSIVSESGEEKKIETGFDFVGIPCGVNELNSLYLEVVNKIFSNKVIESPNS